MFPPRNLWKRGLFPMDLINVSLFDITPCDRGNALGYFLRLFGLAQGHMISVQGKTGGYLSGVNDTAR